MINVQELYSNNSDLSHILKPVFLEDAILFIVQMISQNIIPQTSYLNDFVGFLYLKDFSHSSRHSVLFKIVGRTLPANNFDLYVLHDTYIELIYLIFPIDIYLYS